MTRLPCGCEFDAEEDTIYWNGGMGPGEPVCREHAPDLDETSWRTAVLDGRGNPIGRPSVA